MFSPDWGWNIVFCQGGLVSFLIPPVSPLLNHRIRFKAVLFFFFVNTLFIFFSPPVKIPPWKVWCCLTSLARMIFFFILQNWDFSRRIDIFHYVKINGGKFLNNNFLRFLFIRRHVLLNYISFEIIQTWINLSCLKWHVYSAAIYRRNFAF